MRMKKITAYLAIISLIFMAFGCGGGGGGGSAELKVSRVTVSVDFQRNNANDIQLKASSIIKIRYTVSGPGMQTMSGIVPVTENMVEISLLIPNGNKRCILIEGIDVLNNV